MVFEIALGIVAGHLLLAGLHRAFQAAVFIMAFTGWLAYEYPGFREFVILLSAAVLLVWVLVRKARSTPRPPRRTTRVEPHLGR